MRILIVNGPNLNLLGKREPDIYGNQTLSDIKSWFNKLDEVKHHSIDWFQSNHEGEIIDRLHQSINNIDGIIINPGAFTHYSYAIRDAITAINILTIEIHLSDIESREEFRKISVIKDVCLNQIYGLGREGYQKAFNHLISKL